ncbi:MAG: glycosyltransferase [Nitrospinae bacterium]|nr:glycosyltransferase [Nitrospinota bacterium]
MSNSPVVSVLMPAYNHESYIGEAIESVLEQNFSDFELIIIDDGSQDGTAEKIREFKDKRITFLRQENQGAAKTINRCLSLAQGEFIAILNSDDIYHPDRLSLLLEKMKDETNSFLITDITLIDEKGKTIEDKYHWWIRWYERIKENYSLINEPLTVLFSGNYTVTTSNFFFRRSLLEKVGAMSEHRYIHDYDFAFKAIRANQKGFYFYREKKLLSYRLHGANEITGNKLYANFEGFHFICDQLTQSLPEGFNHHVKHLRELATIIVKETDESWRNRFSQNNNDPTPFASQRTDLAFYLKQYKSERKIYIWGAGSHGKNLHQLFKGFGIEITGFIDKGHDTFSTEIQGIPVHSPSIIETNNSSEIKPFIVIGTMYVDEVVHQLVDVGYKAWEDFL